MPVMPRPYRIISPRSAERLLARELAKPSGLYLLGETELRSRDTRSAQPIGARAQAERGEHEAEEAEG